MTQKSGLRSQLLCLLLLAKRTSEKTMNNGVGVVLRVLAANDLRPVLFLVEPYPQAAVEIITVTALIKWLYALRTGHAKTTGQPKFRLFHG